MKLSGTGVVDLGVSSNSSTVRLVAGGRTIRTSAEALEAGMDTRAGRLEKLEASTRIC
jgi:hypothetical protein